MKIRLYTTRLWSWKSASFLNCVLKECDIFHSGGDVEWTNLPFRNFRWHFRVAALKTKRLIVRTPNYRVLFRVRAKQYLPSGGNGIFLLGGGQKDSGARMCGWTQLCTIRYIVVSQRSYYLYFFRHTNERHRPDSDEAVY
jgi:hypothetical protein